MNKPLELSVQDWADIANLDDVKESFGLGREATENGVTLSGSAYGAKWDFVSGSPGYCGEMATVYGDALQAPMTFYKPEGKWATLEE